MSYTTRQRKIIGFAKPQSFEITSGNMIVTDPCYNKETWCQAKLDNVKIGKWHSTIEYSDEGHWGVRVASIRAWHDSLGDNDSERTCTCDELIQADIGVDSGQAGFFDLEQYPDDPQNDKAFYRKVCSLTLSGTPFSVLEEVGVYPMADLDKLTDEQKALRSSSDYNDRCSYLTSQFGDERPNTDKTKLADALELHGSLGLFGAVPFGAVSSTGYGDGSYRLRVRRNNSGEIIAAIVEFLDNDDE